MKILKFFLIIFFVLSCGVTYSQVSPKYSLTVRNLHLIAPDSLTLDIYMRHINNQIPLEFAGGQFFLDFNCNFGNGGDLTFRLLQSDFDSSCRPSNVIISNCILKAGVIISAGYGSVCFISDSGIGTLIGKYSLRTTTSFLTLDSFKLKWRNPPTVGLATKIFSFIGTVNTDITTPYTHYIDLLAGTESSEISVIPEGFKLYQNYPNPFNPVTKISYDLQNNSNVKLSVFDITGKEIAVLVNQRQNSGNYSVNWNAIDFPSGVYFYRLSIYSDNSNPSGIYTETRRLLLLK